MLSNIAVGTGNVVWGVNSSHVLYTWNGSQWASVSLPFTPSNAEDAISAVGPPQLSLLDTAGGIHISPDGGNTWSTILGTAASITGTTAATFVRGSGGVTYHLNLTVPMLTNNGSGSWPGGCPSGCTHTLKSTVYFGGSGGLHGPGGVTAQMSGPPQNYLTAVATEVAVNCDPFFGDTSAPECTAYYDGTATCTVMGALETYSGQFLLPRFEKATTEAVWTPSTGAPVCPGLGFNCDYPVANNCTAATTPPDLDLTGENIWWPAPPPPVTYMAWLVNALCIKYPPTTGTPWACSYGYARLLSINVPTIPYLCTHNP